MTTIREALQDHDGLEDVNWGNADQVWEIVAGDGQGGEGVEYRQDAIEGYIAYTKTWGAWVLTEQQAEGTTYTVYPARTAAKAGYIQALQAKQCEGVTWEPDYCPIFDRVASTW